MSDLNQTPTSERVQIGIFGRVNAGKSSVLNVLTGQEMAVVSSQKGTTTDPVRKAMELLPIGPVMLYDTPGLGDDTDLGTRREQKTGEILRRIDMALLVVDATEPHPMTSEKKLLAEFEKGSIPFVVIANKCEAMDEAARDALVQDLAKELDIDPKSVMPFSCRERTWGMRPEDLRERIAVLGREKKGSDKRLVADLLREGDVVVLVIPIDESAPKGRLILPQQQVIRDAIEAGAVVMAVRPLELAAALERLKEPPRMVITDSQAFGEVDRILPREIPLTSFSILMARYKGDLPWQAKGAKAIDALEPGARILVAEGCTHHRQCGDIGTVKLPGWIEARRGGIFSYHFTSGGEFPQDVSEYDLIIHCGGCTLPPKEMQWRLARARAAGVPITNYGTMIAYLNGILDRATEVFAVDAEMWKFCRAWK